MPFHQAICHTCRRVAFSTSFSPLMRSCARSFRYHWYYYPLSTGLDPPLVLYFPRVILRTFRRMLKLDPPCSPGCEETIRGVFFSRESILWWCLTNHRFARKRERERLRTQGIHVGGTYRRIGGWGGELEAWKKSVRDMVAAQSVSDRNGD